ncbi:N-acetylglucosaminyl transferase component family protein [Cryptosporidium felis]|nr:N-acetylglucosaminyl transferase component family protein [Cryptosporidium felis]
MLTNELPFQVSLLLSKGLLSSLVHNSGNDYILLGNYINWKNSVGIFATKYLHPITGVRQMNLSEDVKVLGVLKLFGKRNGTNIEPILRSFEIQDITKPLSDLLLTVVADTEAMNTGNYLRISNICDNTFNSIELSKVNIIIYSEQGNQVSNLSRMLNDANQCLDSAINLIENNGVIDNIVIGDGSGTRNLESDLLFEQYRTIIDNLNGGDCNGSSLNINIPNESEPFFLQIFKYLIFYFLTVLSYSSSVVWSAVSNLPIIQTLIQKNICATISQAAFRIKNQRNWIILNHLLNNQRIKQNKKLYSSLQVLFYSSITTVFIDYIFGILFAFGIDTFSKELIILMEKSFFYIYHDAIHTQVKWLMSFPAGFKLNQNLTTLMGNLTLAALKFWCDLTSQHFSDLNHNMFFLIKFVSITCGMSVSIALIWDILNIYSFLLFFIYTIAAKLYNLNLKAIKTFFYIFRGIKSNIFSNIDNNSHYSEQLLIGTILFTIFVLILPTITAFYINFLFIWSCVYITLVLLFFTISTINTFPFYLMLTQALVPSTFSSGIFISEFLHNSRNQFILVFSHKSLGFNSICKPFSDSLNHLIRVHLNIVQIIMSILSGDILHILNLRGSRTHHFKSTFTKYDQKGVVSEEKSYSVKNRNYFMSSGNFHHYIFDKITPIQLYSLF